MTSTPFSAGPSAVALLLLLLANSATAFWAWPAHRASGHVAYKLLSPVAQSAIDSLLGEESLAEASVFADDYLWNGGRWSQGLHFLTTPDYACDYKPEYCKRDFCVVSSIGNYSTRLESAGSSGTANFDLKMLVHFVGDMHNPLHMGFASDRGATMRKGRFFNRKSSLHKIWDAEIVIERVRRDFDRSDDDYFEYLVDTILPDGKFFIPARSWRHCSDRHPAGSCVTRWANELSAMACELAYTQPNGEEVPFDFQLGEEYYQARLGNVEELIVMGGVRLASILNRIFR